MTEVPHKIIQELDEGVECEQTRSYVEHQHDGGGGALEQGNYLLGQSRPKVLLVQRRPIHLMLVLFQL